MWINYLKTAFRNLSRNKGFSIINILGLAVGIAVFVLITLYVKYEFSFDKHFEHADRIYRVTLDMSWSQGPKQETAIAPAPTAYHLEREYPEIIAGTRLTFLNNVLFEYYSEDGLSHKRFNERDIMAADSSLFRVFKMNIIHGNPNALSNIATLVLSERASQKYFGNEDPIGKVLLVDREYSFVVGAVMENMPPNSHFNADIIASTSGRPEFDVNNWRPLNLYSYILFSENADIESFEDKLLDFRDRFYEPWKETSLFRLQKMLDIHLKNDRIYDFAVTSDIRHMFVLSGVALLILVIACINFMNLSTARSIYRSKEVGVRKVVGGTRQNLIKQFIGESIIVAVIATFLAVVLVESLLPQFREVVGSELSIDYKNNILWFLFLAIVVGFFAGTYPAFFTSSFKPVTILKGKSDVSGSSILVRKILVIFQFVIMVLLLVGAGVIYLQMKYVKNKNLGYNKDLVLYANVDPEVNPTASRLIRDKLLSFSSIENASTANVLPGNEPWGDLFKIEGVEDYFPLRTLNVDPNYLNTLEIPVVSGRNFSHNHGTDSVACIINEAAVKRFGWTLENAIGKKVNWNFSQSWDYEVHGHVIGVIKDYHFKSLHQEVEALVLTMNHPSNSKILSKIKPQNIDETIRLFEEVYADIAPELPFEYHFLDKDIENLYKGEKRFESIIIYFVILAIFIACLGLLGLSAFVAEKKFKEIGIRKTFGASIQQILLLFSKEFAIWTIIANIIGWPVGWYLMNEWLDNFAYRIDIPWWLFLLVLATTLFIAISTISYLAFRAANKNPVEAIRYE